jgi:hypothetical protein
MAAMLGQGRAWIVVLALAASTSAAAFQVGTGVVLRSVQVTVDAGVTVVTIEADAALPAPTPHSLDSPSRIYVDFPGVVPKAKGTTQVPGAGVVDRVRIAQNSSDPDVTRVVLDLPQLEPIRVNADERQSGRIRLFVGRGAESARSGGVPPAATTPVAAPRAPAPLPAPPRPISAPAERSAPPAAPAPRPPAGDIERYRAVFSEPLQRIQAQRSVLSAIDVGANVAADTLRRANLEFNDLRRLLGGAAPAAAAKSAHDLLVASCTLGATATRLRLDAPGDDSLKARQNAGSAAAGSLMLLDRACATLNCSGSPR